MKHALEGGNIPYLLPGEELHLAKSFIPSWIKSLRSVSPVVKQQMAKAHERRLREVMNAAALGHAIRKGRHR